MKLSYRVRVSDEMSKQVEKHCKKVKMTPSEFIRHLIKIYFNE